MEIKKVKDLNMRRVTSSEKKSHSFKDMIQKLVNILDEINDDERKDEVFNEILSIYDATNHSDPNQVKTSYTRIKAMVETCLRDFNINY
jgi:hypothetical protein